ncbi:hypothetical protein TNCV_41571 [Trichonephila clavipes]|nr:hypothetical protein TNCV_41571 [Trichonephila clavipes]
MRAGSYCAHPSIRDHWGAEEHGQMFRSGGQSEARPPVFKSPSKLRTHLSTHFSRDEKVKSTLPSPGIEPGPVVCKRDTLPLDHWASD